MDIKSGVEETFGIGFKAQVEAALLSMNDAELLKSFPRKSFVPASNHDYEPIENVAKTIGLID